MKRVLSFFVVIVVIFTSLTGCSLLQSSSSGNSKVAMVTIVHPEGEEIVEFSSGKENQITPIYQKGKILLGYYATEAESGVEYINAFGKSIKWDYSYPKKLYAVYGEADYSVKYTSTILCDEDSERVMYHEGVKYKYYNFSKNSPAATAEKMEFSQLLLSDSSAEVRITMYSMMRPYYDTSKTVKMDLLIGNDTIASCTRATNGVNNYVAMSASAVVKAKQLTSGTNEIIALIHNASYVKNIYFTVEFVNK